MVDQELLAKLAGLRLAHREVDDSYYSCAAAPDVFGEVDSEAACDCGADLHNALLDEVIAAIAALG